LTVRYAIAALIAVAGACSPKLPDPVTPGPAPQSALTVATTGQTYQGSADAAVITGAYECSRANQGIGLLAQATDAAVTAVFQDWPQEGVVYDLSNPATSDLVVVSADVGVSAFCTNDGNAAGSVEVRRFEQVGSRIVADVVITNADAGPTTINAHLYH
jgi:hypothetical protein